jgi:NitT/TauT family transport system permease protein
VRRLIAIGWALLPPLTFIAMVALWSASIAVFRIPAYLLPGPGSVFSRLIADAPMLWSHSMITLTEILLGFGLTVVTAIPLGLAIALSLIARQIMYPPLMLMQLVPKIAVAPLFLVWLGFGMESKVLLTVLMTFFPLLLASISGFQILDDRLLYLTRSMGASGWQTFRYLRFPAALPVIFSGIKSSATIAATAAIVAEFVGANRGLGYVLLRGTSTMDIELTFAVLVVLTIIGIAINYVVEFSE